LVKIIGLMIRISTFEGEAGALIMMNLGIEPIDYTGYTGSLPAWNI